MIMNHTLYLKEMAGKSAYPNNLYELVYYKHFLKSLLLPLPYVTVPSPILQFALELL